MSRNSIRTWVCCAALIVCATAARAQKTPAPAVDLLTPALAGPLAAVDEVVYATRQIGKDGHWYANLGYYCPDENRKAYTAGGSLCLFNLRTRAVKKLIDDPEGSVRDPQVHYDGKRVLFSWRRAGTEFFNLYEINTDGTGLRRVTDVPFDDIEPTYLPDGDIAFVSTRAKRWVQCWLTQVAIVYRSDPNGDHARPISTNVEHDNTPWPLPDGRLLYTRWEYVDRSQLGYHHLWSFNPDGTAVANVFGNTHHGTVMIDAKPIPGTDRIVAIFSPGHGRAEHAGAVTVIDPRAGPDEPGAARALHKSNDMRDPYPLAEDLFLVAERDRLLLLDGQGRTQVIHTAAGVTLHEPRPITPRPRERVIAPRVDLAQATGKVVLADVTYGRSMTGVAPGEVKKLLVLETLPKPVNFTGGMEPLSHGGTFTLERILGTIPVEPDGSAYVEIPAMRPVFFVALDKDDLSIKRMQSFISVQPGETLSCAGCHEQRYQAAPPRSPLLALRRAPSPIEPIADVPDVMEFPRDIQPILDARCVSCHNPDRRDGRLNLAGDRGPLYSHSYYSLFARHLVVDGRNQQGNHAPRTIGSSASPIMKYVDGSHYGATLTPLEKKRLRLWIDSGATYPGTYASLLSGMLGGYVENTLDRTGADAPAVKAAANAMARRCAGCHTDKLGVLPASPWDDVKNQPWLGVRDRISRHIVFNLTRPEKSTALLAPLARSAGGYETCAKDGKATFADTADPDYQLIFDGVRAAKAQLDRIKRFDMPGFQPNPQYIREMKRYGILAKDVDPARTPLDPYALDQAYWKSLWWTPVKAEAE